MFAAVLIANVLGLRVSSGFQLGLSSVLFGVVAVAVAVALPSRAGDNWTPFAPHGWWAVGTAADIPLWLFIGWGAGRPLAGGVRAAGARPAAGRPRRVRGVALLRLRA